MWLFGLGPKKRQDSGDCETRTLGRRKREYDEKHFPKSKRVHVNAVELGRVLWRDSVDSIAMQLHPDLQFSASAGEFVCDMVSEMLTDIFMAWKNRLQTKELKPPAMIEGLAEAVLHGDLGRKILVHLAKEHIASRGEPHDRDHAFNNSIVKAFAEILNISFSLDATTLAIIIDLCDIFTTHLIGAAVAVARARCLIAVDRTCVHDAIIQNEELRIIFLKYISNMETQQLPNTAVDGNTPSGHQSAPRVLSVSRDSGHLSTAGGGMSPQLQPQHHLQPHPQPRPDEHEPLREPQHMHNSAFGTTGGVGNPPSTDNRRRKPFSSFSSDMDVQSAAPSSIAPAQHALPEPEVGGGGVPPRQWNVVPQFPNPSYFGERACSYHEPLGPPILEPTLDIPPAMPSQQSSSSGSVIRPQLVRSASFEQDSTYFPGAHPCISEAHFDYDDDTCEPEADVTDNKSRARGDDSSWPATVDLVHQVSRQISDTGKVAPHCYRGGRDTALQFLFMLSFPVLVALVASALELQQQKCESSILNALSCFLRPKVLFASPFLVMVTSVAANPFLLWAPLGLHCCMMFLFLLLSRFPKTIVWMLFYTLPLLTTFVWVTTLMARESPSFALVSGIGAALLVVALLRWLFGRNMNFAAVMLGLGARGVIANQGLLVHMFLLLIPVCCWGVYTANASASLDSSMSISIFLSGKSEWTSNELLMLSTRLLPAALLLQSVCVGMVVTSLNTMITARTIACWYFHYKVRGTWNSIKSVLRYGLGTSIVGGIVGTVIRHTFAALKRVVAICLPKLFFPFSLFTMIPRYFVIPLVDKLERVVQGMNLLALTVAGITTESYADSGARAVQILSREGGKFITLMTVLNRVHFLLSSFGAMFASLVYVIVLNSTARASVDLPLWSWIKMFAMAPIVCAVLCLVVTQLCVDCLWTASATCALTFLEQRRLDEHDPANARRRSRSPLESEMAKVLAKEFA